MFKKIKKILYQWLKSYYNGDKFLYQRNLSRGYNFSKPLVLIYTMGKVGSTSIYESFKDHNSKYNVIHLHTLNSSSLKKRERFIKKEVYHDKQYTRHVYTNLLWKPIWVKKLLAKNKKPIHIITVIREPIGRNISLFFQWLEFEESENTYFFKSRNEKYPFQITTPKDDLTELYKVFLNTFTRQSHNEWLQEELNAVFQLNLLEIPFDKRDNFAIYEDDDKRLLTLKLEKINETFKKGILNFLQEDITLLRMNEASAKDINVVYKKFKAGLRLPKQYVDELYNSAYIKHFYTLDEIEEFQLKWRNQPL
tara:strand:+ start:3808 stop:4731 length:924 start_codon:yes stop_codon:yes gene_type:complete